MANDVVEKYRPIYLHLKIKGRLSDFPLYTFQMRANKKYSEILSQKPKPFIRGDVNYYLCATSAKNLKMQQGTSIIFAIVNKHRGNALRSLTCIGVHGQSKCPSHPLEAILGKEKKKAQEKRFWTKFLSPKNRERPFHSPFRYFTAHHLPPCCRVEVAHPNDGLCNTPPPRGKLHAHIC